MENKITIDEIAKENKNGIRIDDVLLRNALVNSGKLRSDYTNLYILNEADNIVENIGVAGVKAISRVREELLDEHTGLIVASKKIEIALNDLIALPSIFINTQDFRNTTWVNLENGVMDLQSLEVIQSKVPNLLFDSKLNFSFREGAINLKKDVPVFADFCERSLGVLFEEDGSIKRNGTKLASLLQGIGYLISNIGSLRKAVFFLGPPASGKSTLLHLLAKVITPSSNVSAYNFRQFSKSFTMTTVANAKINIVEEVDCVSRPQMEAFKLLVAGGRLSGERKYQSDVELKANVKLAIASNSLPLFEVGNLAPIVDRIHLVIFENTIPSAKREFDLEDRLWQERDIIFSLALVEFSKVLQNNGVFKMEAIAETLLNRLVEESNSEELFVKGYLKSCPGNNLAASRVFDAYKAFCRENGFSAKSSHCLYQAILLAYGSAGEKKKVRDPYVLANSSVQGFCGLALEGGETDGN